MIFVGLCRSKHKYLVIPHVLHFLHLHNKKSTYHSDRCFQFFPKSLTPGFYTEEVYLNFSYSPITSTNYVYRDNSSQPRIRYSLCPDLANLYHNPNFSLASSSVRPIFLIRLHNKICLSSSIPSSFPVPYPLS